MKASAGLFEPAIDIVRALRCTGAPVMLNMLLTGFVKATWLYDQAALEVGVAFVNGMPTRKESGRRLNSNSQRNSTRRC